jgi:predicted O-methyltransferase YrrM
MDVTKQLLEDDGEFEQHNEGDWQNPFDPAKPGFSSFNDAGIEVETGEFLYALTRLLKPTNVLETGTHFGVGAAYIGSALHANHMGHLDTIEFIPPIHEKAEARIKRLGLSDVVTCHFGDVDSFYPGEKQYKLILLDTEPQTRFAELVKFYDHLEPGGFVFIHDLHRHMHQLPSLEKNIDHPGQPYWPYGKLPIEVDIMVRQDKLRPFHFDTPRGLTGFYKPHPDDHKFL